MASALTQTGRVIETAAPGGRAVLFVPEAPLSGLVNSVWLYEADAPPHARERVLPSGSMQLIINLREDRLLRVPMQMEMHVMAAEEAGAV